MKETLNVKLYRADKEQAIKDQTFSPLIKRVLISIYYMPIAVDVGDTTENQTS